LGSMSCFWPSARAAVLLVPAKVLPPLGLSGVLRTRRNTDASREPVP
jgi:hypothetical protein